MTYLSIQLLAYIPTGTCSSACQFVCFSFGLTCALTCELICWSMYPKDLPTPKFTYLLILILSFRQTRKTYRSTQPRVHIPIDATVFHPTCSFWSLHSDKPLIPTCPLTYYPTYPPPPLPHTSSSVYMFILTFLVSVKVQACPSTHLLVRVPRDVPENEPTFSSWWLTSG